MKMLHCLLLFSLLFMIIHGKSFNNFMSCSQTPYPDLCFHYINPNDNVLTADIDETSVITRYQNLTIRATLNQAMVVHDHLRFAMDLDSFDDDDRTKFALIDCLELYEDSITELNRLAMSSMSVNSSIDHLTLLSASLANHQTCQDGFRDFGLFSFDDPFQILSNFSKLVSNSLAITKAAVAVPPTSSSTSGGRRLLGGSFPQWIYDVDRILLQGTVGNRADMVVAQDGSGDFRTISEAVTAAEDATKGCRRFVIYVKGGIYKENVVIKKGMKNVMMIGDGMDRTIVTAMKNVQDGSTTFQSATFAVAGEGFIAKDMTFENTAGPEKHQAVALRSNADRSIFYRCSFKGYQDTLYAHSNRQFYRECHIYGTVDFIFGDAVAVFQNCNIFVRKPMMNQKNTITAHARSDPNENTGFVIHNSVIQAAPDLKPVEGLYGTYLGRPWKPYSRTVIMKSFLDGLIEPAGWLPWAGDFGLRTVYYGEFMNTGGGAYTKGRVQWPGYHVMTSAAEAERFTVESFLEGGSWIPATGVPFANGL
ncbi:pectinesterase [Benincasa hispida]|uniref:pectinesterase n=1 Tax=Benincasa hispida TaxID=102211 RepID=UPI0019000820|nr:pectinesterase [Benincasa hispida]